ncbi:hypothetical protein CEXT_222751 [Caerostris extrusa]|uniref:Uncharacterized protein n=1 Tax=Caerostris extrusa TaxID=172846 RepID=A0AAV4XWE0_CAEEX|nr:hypothetical protein CEXT_222751 [Caerostris extrusa]
MKKSSTCLMYHLHFLKKPHVKAQMGYYVGGFWSVFYEFWNSGRYCLVFFQLKEGRSDEKKAAERAYWKHHMMVTYLTLIIGRYVQQLYRGGDVMV